ncbi:MAG TPA: hypothetical protein VM716_13550 [Gemmatimonadales bacterium]|nr:hypothetical protein [Gemmatimonadales bacterium]
MSIRPLVYPLCLLVGSLLAVTAGALHPDMVSEDGPAQLAHIAHSEGWRAIHWMFLFSFPIALTGLVGLARVHAGTPGENAVRAGLIVATFAYAAWTIIVAFMGGAGWSLAHSYTVSDAGVTATRAVFLYDMLRPFALAAQRVAGFALGLSTLLFGWGVVDGKVLRRWLGSGGMVAGAVGMALALVFREDTKADQAAFVLPVVWQLVAAGVMLRRAASVAP